VMTEELVASLPGALAACRAEAAPAQTDHEEKMMAVELGRWLALGHGNSWRVEQRTEFITGHVREFSDLPYRLVMDAIGRARRGVEFADRFTKWVVDQIGGDVDALRLEEERLVKLGEIAGE
jgi:hypothetical protein